MSPKQFFELEFPLSRTHCGVPMANGNMGVLVWGADNRLCLTVNRCDLWDHRGGEQVLPGQSYRDLVDLYDPFDVGPVNDRFVRKPRPAHLEEAKIWWPSSRLPVGRFELELKPGFKLEKARLEYATGELSLLLGSAELRLIMDLGSNQLLVEDPGKAVAAVVPRPAWDWVGELLDKVGFAPPERSADGWRQACPSDPGVTATCRKSDFGYAIALTLDGEKTQERSLAAAKSESSAWWKGYWSDAPQIGVPDTFLDGFHRFALYKFACATHPNGVACGLQGPWHEEYQRAQWSGDFHFNVNVQQVYTLAFACGKFEHMLPLFDMIESAPFQRTMRDNAKNLFGIDDGLLLTHAVDDLGMQCGGISAGAVLDFACGGWTAQLYWLYYQYTQDKEFLRKRAYPFILGVTRVMEETLEERDGRLSIPLSISAEYGCTFPVRKNGRLVHQNTGRDPSYQLACLHMLADMLLEASETLGIKPRPIWKDIKERLPKYTLAGEPGDEHIAIWADQDLDVCHRHHSHLASVFPFDNLGEWDEEDARIIDNTIDHWILRGMGQWSEWCYPWAAIIQARMGFKESAATLMDIWRKVFVNEAWSTVYLPKFRGLSAHRRADMRKPKESSEIMQLDGTMVGATAIMELLVHVKGGTVKLFPASPDEWGDVWFKDVRLPGAFVIAAERKGGEVSATVKSLKGGKLKIQLSDSAPAQVLSFVPGETKKL